MIYSREPAKISNPRLSCILPRERLFQLIDRYSNYPLLWITGPPGAGKTTLAASWLESRQVDPLWYQIDEGDSDPASFFHYLRLATRKISSRKKKTLPALTPEYLPGILTFSRRFFDNLYSRLIHQVGKNTSFPPTIVFDNFQEVPEGTPLHEVLYAGIAQVPEGIKIIFISRKGPPETFVGLKANSLMKTIGWDELKFTLDESNEMVRLRYHETISAEALRGLYERTDGWVAGIVLSLEGMDRGAIESPLSRSPASEDMFHYFAREIFQRSDPEIQDFLLKTSVFKEMSAEMAQSLSGSHMAHSVLSDLDHRNCFTQKLNSNVPIYRYHPLFREFLEHLAARLIDNTHLKTLQEKAAAILEANNKVEDAVEVLLRIHDWPGIVSLILRHAFDFAGQGRYRTLLDWIEKIPEETVEQEPWLHYWIGVCRSSYSPLEGIVHFENAYKLFRVRRDSLGTFLSLSGMIESIIYSANTFKPLDKVISLIDEALKEFRNFPSSDAEVLITLDRLCAVLYRQPWHPDLKKMEAQALSILLEKPVQKEWALVIQALMYPYIIAGRMYEPLFRLCYDLFRSSAIPLYRIPLFRINRNNLESLVYMAMGKFENMMEASKRGLALASETGIHVLDIWLLANLTSASLCLGKIETADLSLHNGGLV